MFTGKRENRSVQRNTESDSQAFSQRRTELCVQRSQLQSCGNVRAERIQYVHEILFLSTDNRQNSSTKVNPATKFHLSQERCTQPMR